MIRLAVTLLILIPSLCFGGAPAPGFLGPNGNGNITVEVDDSTGVEVDFATETAQTSGSQKTQIVGSDGTVQDVISHEGEESAKVVFGHNAQFAIHLDAEDVAATTGYMLINISDTANWPHTLTEHIVLEWYAINVNPSTAFRGDIEFGFLSSVDDTNGDFNILHTWHIGQQGSQIIDKFDHSSHGVDLKSTTMFGPSSANDTLFQTDVAIVGPDGNTFNSGDGDMVLKIVRTSGSVDVGIVVGYITR